MVHSDVPLHARTEAQDVKLMAAEKTHAAKREWVPGGSFKLRDKTSITPVKLTSSKPNSSAPDGHLLQRTIKRRQRLQELYVELQALGE